MSTAGWGVTVSAKPDNGYLFAGVSENKIHNIFVDREGWVWLATRDGLKQFDGKDVISFQKNANDLFSISSDTVWVIYEDSASNLWVGTSGGLNYFDRQNHKFYHFVHDPENPESLSNNNVTSVFEDKTGTLWIGTDGGLNKLIYWQIEKYYASAVFKQIGSRDNTILNIAEDKSGNLWITTKGDGIYKFDQETTELRQWFGEAGYNIQSVSVDVYNHLWFSDENGVVFGYNPETDQKMNQMSSAGINTSPDLVIVFILFVSVFVLYGYYQNRMQARFGETKIRTSIARDLHDDISSTLSSINFFADAIEKRSLSEKEKKRFLELISKSSSEAKEKISDIIWVIHPQDDNWESLFLKCKRYASDILDCRNIDYKFIIEGIPPIKVKLEVKKNTWLIFRELITNVVRHANANYVEIKFSIDGNTIGLSVSDDGKGFDPEKLAEPGYGLSNIKDRVEALKGKFNLDSEHKKGTRWQMQFPV